ncbi:MAG: hypothetical protein K0S23_3465 [Fluviicola sp.]|jgi:hypothetical protein|uniref:T9SS type A sorting domain-containing protein n=1 Tax=Fluviicola sp. TaxID=1917219 RepID=UPI00260388B3|nr:T9SS type A sorting domain-containing protein [Fluviicola sp.]MDF3029158.1 hypothetical protein [Fluviicola sp.]
MNTSTLKQFLAFSTFLVCQNTFGQIPAIDSLILIPENPNTGDEIKLICYSTFPTGGCDMQNSSVTIQGDQITVSMEHEPGMLTYICHNVDTISLGDLNPGDYELHANLIIQPMDEIVDSDSLFFSVDAQLRIDEHSDTGSLSVYPNPFDRELQIQTDAVIEEVEISSVSGQKISVNKEHIPVDKTIDTSDLKNGIYLLKMTDNKGNKYTRRIIKNS